MYLDVADSATLPYGWSRYAQFSLAVINHHTAKFTVRKGMPLMMFICQLIAIVFKQHGNEIIIIFISSGNEIAQTVQCTPPLCAGLFSLYLIQSYGQQVAICLMHCVYWLWSRVHLYLYIVFIVHSLLCFSIYVLYFVVSLFSRFISWMDISFFGMILQVVLQTVLCFENQNLEPAERGLHHGSLRLL